MGIYGALSTAVTGLRAQSFALENISGNIANSQTTGFKRVDTDFLDLVPDQPVKLQSSGSVLAQSRATNTTQGDVKSVSNTTYMAVGGDGFFVVEPAIGQSDGQAIFGGDNFYTRRGDFEVDKSGYLVNGSGYYLKGMPIDPQTGNISSSLPQVLRISSAFLPASPSTRINYQLNLPQLPKTNAYSQSKTVGSELIQPGDYGVAPDVIANMNGGTTGVGLNTNSTFASLGYGAGDTIVVGTTTYTFAAGGALGDPKSTGTPPAVTINLLADPLSSGTNTPTTVADLLAIANTAGLDLDVTSRAILTNAPTQPTTIAGTNTLASLGLDSTDTFSVNGTVFTFGGPASATAASTLTAGPPRTVQFSLNYNSGANQATVQNLLTAIQGELGAGATATLSGNKIVLTGSIPASASPGITLSGQATSLTKLGLSQSSALPSWSNTNRYIPSVAANQSDSFIDQSISGGAITVYSSNGAPVNVQLRWAKSSSTDVGGTDTWQLFYLANSSATGNQPMWVNAGSGTTPPTTYSFTSDGTLNPPIDSTNLNLTVDGIALGNVQIQFGKGGVSQFADANGTAGVTALSQNGYPAGQYQSVSINDNGRVVISYDNGQTVEMAQVITANFNAANQLKRMDGGIFAATSDSGEPIINTNGDVMGSSLESSNTDISEEFTKLIVTQQAYAAGTKIVSAADDMLQQALNMIR